MLAKGVRVTVVPLRVLIVEDDAAEVELLTHTLQSSEAGVVVHAVQSLDNAIDFLTHQRPDVVIVNLFLRDSRGLQTFTELRERFSDIPFVIISSPDELSSATQAVRAGARDFIIKGRVNTAGLVRSLKCAIERERIYAAVHELSLFDELTGLHNRRGFTVLAQQLLNISKRTEQGMLFMYADVDGIRSINELYGYYEGDQALIEAAHAFRDTLRTCDVVGRFEGDEFTALLPGVARADAEQVENRVKRAVAATLARNGRPYTLSLTVGSMWVDPADSPNLSNFVDWRKKQKGGRKAALLHESKA
jgi:diguanylate cyclase (GGDEF)-like protein